MLKLVMEAAEKEKKAGRHLAGSIDEKTGQVTEEYAILAIQIAESYHGIEKIAEGMKGKLDEWIGQGITDIHELYPMSWDDLTAMLLARKQWREERGTVREGPGPGRPVFRLPASGSPPPQPRSSRQAAAGIAARWCGKTAPKPETQPQATWRPTRP